MSAFNFDLSIPTVPQVLSADGRYLAFLSRATDLVTGQTDTNGGPDVFLFDRMAGTVTLVSHAAGAPATAGSGASDRLALSADGTHLAFASQATNLVAGQTEANGGSDVFLFERNLGSVTLASRSAASATTTGNGPSGQLFFPRISADGRVLAFDSGADDLAPADFDAAETVFAYVTPDPGEDFHTVTPCRLLDTRQAGQGPVLTSGETRRLTLTGHCGIPATAKAVAVNLTVVQPTSSGRLTLYPGDAAMPPTSTINFQAGDTRANNALLSLALDGTGTLSVTSFLAGGGTIHLLVDASGWFE